MDGDGSLLAVICVLMDLRCWECDQGYTHGWSDLFSGRINEWIV